jgi:hypothetical protein
MPSGGGDQDRMRGRVDGGRTERVEGSRLSHRATGVLMARSFTARKVKLNGTRIDGGEPTDRKEIMGDMRGYENVVKIEQSRETRGTY